MFAKPLMFFSSYAPLFGILAVRFDPLWLRVACVVAMLLGVVTFVVLLRLQRRVGAGTYDVMEVREAGGEAASYLATYLLPFVVVANPSVRDVVAYVLFLVVAGVVSSRSTMIQVNPLLFIFGYHVLRLVDSNRSVWFLISRKSPMAGDRIAATLWSDDVIVQTGDI